MPRIACRWFALCVLATSAAAQADVTSTTYEGRELTAAWRQAAASRIEQYRKADLNLMVVDKAGMPVPDAQVHVEMTDHAFQWGSAINSGRMWRFSNDPYNTNMYKNTFASLFNTATDEGAMTPTAWQDSAQRTDAQKTVTWLGQNGISIIGHTMVWPSWRHSPAAWKTQYDSLVKAQGTTAAKAWLKTTINDQITSVGTAFRGKMNTWIVVNEQYASHLYTPGFVDLLGSAIVPAWFRTADAVVNPTGTAPAAKVKLFFNDNTILNNGGKNWDRLSYYTKWISYVKQQKAPLDGMGFQSHFDGGVLTPIPVIYSNLDSIGRLGVRLKITEFTLTTTNEQLQADYTRDFMTIAFSHPNVDAFIWWGFWEAQHYSDNAAMYRTNWTIKPNGQAYKDLVFGTWWTDVTDLTDDEGITSVRGFRGTYEITVTVNGVSETYPLYLNPADGNVDAVFELGRGISAVP